MSVQVFLTIFFKFFLLLFSTFGKHRLLISPLLLLLPANHSTHHHLRARTVFSLDDVIRSRWWYMRRKYSTFFFFISSIYTCVSRFRSFFPDRHFPRNDDNNDGVDRDIEIIRYFFFDNGRAREGVIAIV